MSKTVSLPVACATFILPALQIVFRSSFGPLRSFLDRSFDHDVVYIGCDLVLLALMGMSIIVAVIALVFIDSKHSDDRLSRGVAVAGLLSAFCALGIVVVMEYFEELGGTWGR